MLVWHVLIIFGVQALSSGRAAILGYTMPIFVALVGYERLHWQDWAAVVAIVCAIALVLRKP
jgi:drug/metabolite transporter (DMT)-like permease